MARRTDGEKIDELEKLVATLTERLDTAVQTTKELYGAHSATAVAAADLRRECERDLALLKREGEDLKAWKAEHKKVREEWGRRIVSFGPPVLGAVINVV